MNTVNNLLDKAREVCPSDNVIAGKIKVSRSAVSKWRHGGKIEAPQLARLTIYCVVEVAQVTLDCLIGSVAVENTDGHVCHLLLVDLIAGAESFEDRGPRPLRNKKAADPGVGVRGLEVSRISRVH